jgi:hypothetical protein
MTPQERPEHGRTRREGNVIRMQTQFATRVRLAVISLAKREAWQAIIRKIKADGKVKVSLMAASEITRQANAYLREHAAELLAQAEASGTVQKLCLRACVAAWAK